MNLIGLDIGGANLKAAHVDGACATRAFPLWKTPEGLVAALREVASSLPEGEMFAVTMTGELADCYRTKREGVGAILDAVESLAGARPVQVWSTGGEFVPPEFAREFPLLVAAANWHALASWVGRLVPRGPALLIDIGSTTTDVIPLRDGRPVPNGLTDLERLQSGELEYSGVARTPLSALAHSVPFRGDRCGLTAEVFATTRDLYLWRGASGERPDDNDTANGRPATRAESRERLARMLCADGTEVGDAELDELCAFFCDVQANRIRGAIDRILARFEEPCRQVIVSGSGEFLATSLAAAHSRLRNASVVRLSEVFTPEAATAACAFALTRLAEAEL